MSVPRYLFIDQRKVSELELHSFYDASMQAYSAAVYVRSAKNNNIVTNLLTAKSIYFRFDCFCRDSIVSSS